MRMYLPLGRNILRCDSRRDRVVCEDDLSPLEDLPIFQTKMKLDQFSGKMKIMVFNKRKRMSEEK
jgi:hypothetical protein